MIDAARLTAAELSGLYASRAVSPLDVTEVLLARIHAINPVLNALYIVDEEGARAMARKSQSRWQSGRARGPLDGVPTTVKDALPLTGHPSYRGSAAHNAEAQAFDDDAPCVARMREAGMVFLGKTTMPDFGILASGNSSKHGVTRNPWNLAHTSGGSSSGAAASIAAGLNPLAVGTDIVGSIRLPASFCGIVGFKPSQGRVPYYVPNSPSLVAGPMARTVLDCAMFMNVIARPDSRDYTALSFENMDYTLFVGREVEAKRLAYVTDLGFGTAPDPAVLQAVETAVTILRQAGHHVTKRTIRFSPAELRSAERFYKARCRAEFLTMPTDRQDDAAVIRDWSNEASTMSATDLYSAFNDLQRMRGRAARLIDGCDFVILPTVHRTAFAAELASYDPSSLFEPWINTFLFNLSEQPACSVPCGSSPSGLPIGLQIVGNRFDDTGVLGFSAHFEALAPVQEWPTSSSMALHDSTGPARTRPQEISNE